MFTQELRFVFSWMRCLSGEGNGKNLPSYFERCLEWHEGPEGCSQDQFAEGFSKLSITMMSTGPMVASSFNLRFLRFPSLACKDKATGLFNQFAGRV